LEKDAAEVTDGRSERHPRLAMWAWWCLLQTPPDRVGATAQEGD